jgi:protein MpaA
LYDFFVKIRDFGAVTRRLAKVARERAVTVEVAGSFDEHPFFVVRIEPKHATFSVFLSAGMHGEEPAGVEAVLQWLEKGEFKKFPHVRWLIFPCINPWGWERDWRLNARGLDLNRQFRGRRVPEVKLIKRILRGEKFDLGVEFHEDYEATGYYLYELSHRTRCIGEEIIASVRRVIKISRDPVIDGNRAERGLIRRPPHLSRLRRRKRWPMAFYVFTNHAEHILGSETPKEFPMKQRVAAHHAALKTALNLLARKAPRA